MSNEILIPTACPSCASPLEVFGLSGQLRCTGDDCTGNLVRRLTHWAGKTAMDIDAIGPKFIQIMVDAGLLTNVTDFYRLKRHDLLRLEGVEDGRATKFLESIEESKQRGMRRVLIGLSITGTGAGTAERLCKVWTNVEGVACGTIPSLMGADLGVVKATAVWGFFQRPAVRQMIVDLRELGVSLDRAPEDAPIVVSNMEGEFVDLKVCVTGSLSVGREDFHKLLQSHGAIIAKSVSSKTDVLVVGANVGKNKTDAAKKHGVRVITEEEARKAMGLA